MFLNRFPVRIGTPEQKRYETREEALECINRHNGLTHLYVSLYNRGIIDKIAWDFDLDKYDHWEDMIAEYRDMKERIEDEGWSYMCVFSGNGLHFYLKTEPTSLENPRGGIREVQMKYQQELNLHTDDAIFGDVKRIMRIPNTYHPGAQRFCIPLRPEEIYLTQEEIHELAQSQRNVKAITDGDDYPIRQHDSIESAYMSSAQTGKVPGNFNPAEVEPEGTLFPIYPCISNLLKNWQELEERGHGLGFRRRFLIILHLKETGHTYEETVAILKKYLSNQEFHHAVYDEKQVEQIYKRDDLLFPRCDSLMTEIPCIHDPPDDECESKDDLYL